MNFGTFNSTAFNQRFLAGTIWVSASLLGVSEAYGHNNTLRYVESDAAVYSQLEGYPQRILGVNYGGSLAKVPINGWYINGGDYVNNAVYPAANPVNSDALLTDTAQRLSNSTGFVDASAYSDAWLYRESLVYGKSNAVSYSYSASDRIKIIKTRLVYMEGFAVGYGRARGLANVFVGRSNTFAEGGITAYPHTRFRVNGSGLASAESSGFATLQVSTEGAATAEAVSHASADITSNNIRYAYCQGAIITEAVVEDSALRLARSPSSTEVLCTLEGTFNRARAFRGTAAFAEALSNKPNIYRKRNIFAYTAAEAISTGLSFRNRVASCLPTEASVTFNGVAVRLGKGYGNQQAEASALDSAVRLVTLDGADQSDSILSDTAQRLGKFSDICNAEAVVSQPDPTRYGNSFGDTGGSASLESNPIRYTNAFGDQNAEALGTDLAVRLVTLDGADQSDSVLNDSAQRLGKSAGAVEGAAFVDNTLTVRYANAFGDAVATAQAVDTAVRLGKAEGDQEPEALISGTAVRLGKVTGDSPTECFLYDYAVRLGKSFSSDIGEAQTSAGFLVVSYLFADSYGVAASSADTVRLAKSYGDLTGLSFSTGFATRKVRPISEGTAEALSDALPYRTRKFNTPVRYPVARINEVPINEVALGGFGYRINMDCDSITEGFGRLNANMSRTEGRIYEVPYEELGYLIPAEDRVYRL